MKDDFYFCLIFVILFMVSLSMYYRGKQLDRIERRLEVITPAFECAGYAYNYEVKEYRIEESVKDSLSLP